MPLNRRAQRQNFLMLINLNEKASDWNSDINLSRVLFEAFATTGGKMKILAHKAAWQQNAVTGEKQDPFQQNFCCEGQTNSTLCVSTPPTITPFSPASKWDRIKASSS